MNFAIPSRYYVLINMLYLYIFVLACVHSEIITLRNKKNILYVLTKSAMNSFVFLNPPVNKTNNKLPLIWANDDWIDTTAANSVQGPVTDKRWEDFEYFQGNYLRFVEKSVSFSVYLSTKIDFFLSNNERSQCYPIDVINNAWKHYTVLSENNKVFIMESDRILKKIDDFSALQTVVISTNTTFWKIHDYRFRYSDKTTKSEPTTLKIPPSGKSFLTVYTSLGKDCFLEIHIRSNKRNETIIITPVDEDLAIIKSWRGQIIEIEPEEDIELLFFRKKYEFNDGGYWAMDIKLGDDLGIYTVTLSDEKLTQSTFQILNNIKEWDTYKINTTFSCPPGYIGQFCDVSCKVVLGQEYPYCDKHEICQDLNCVCAWGYQGPFCNQTCQNNTWGLSCNRICNPTYEKCNPVTGEALNLKTVQISIIWIYILIAISMTIIITSILFIGRRNIYSTYVKVRTFL